MQTSEYAKPCGCAKMVSRTGQEECVDARFEGANVDGPEKNDFRKGKNSS